MKYILTITILLSTSLFANYAFTGENTGKIDMHGGKGDKLLTNKNGFSNTKTSPLSNIGIKKPTMPKKPASLVKEEKKNIKKETKEISDKIELIPSK